MPKKKRSRLYVRNQGGVDRFYADFRAYREVGGRQEPMVPKGEKQATMDRDVAEKLCAGRLAELDAMRRGLALHGRVATTPIAAYADQHLLLKKRAGKVTREWLALSELFLKRAALYFGPTRDLASITVENVQGWATHLATTPTDKDRNLSAGTVRHALNALSNLYRRAQSEGKVPPGFNPVASMLEKPAGMRTEARWLEVPDAALLLEAARTLPPLPSQGDALGAVFIHALVGTFLLTGMRSQELLGLEVEDVSFDRKIITVRPNDWRRLKTAKSARVVPMQPQLEEILRPWVFGTDRPPGRLLFPSYITGREAMLTDWRKSLDRAAGRAGWRKGEIRSRMFRHSYCAARLQTLDHGAPVSPYTVQKELGHGSLEMVTLVYSHLGTVQQRSETVEFRVEQHAEKLRDRLEAMAR